MEETNPSTIATVAAGGVLSLLALAFTIQRFFKGFNENNATSTVVTLLRDEVIRMGKQNAGIAQELNKLQTEILGLNKQLLKLTSENHKLQDEVRTLIRQIASLQNELSKYRNKE